MTGRQKALVGATIAAVVLAGLAARVWLASLAPKYSYSPDAFGNIAHGLTAEPNGLLKAYEYPVDVRSGEFDPNSQPAVNGWVWQKEQGKFTRRSYKEAYGREYKFPHKVRYPPLGLTALWLHVKLLALFDPSLMANTFTSRLVMSIGSILCDLVMAIGALLMARQLFGPRAGWAAGAVVWLLPPLVMNTTFWGQVDSWVLAPTLLALWMMLRRRWLAAGILLGIATQLKPQGLLMAPIALFAAAIMDMPPGAAAGKEFLRRVGLGALGALGVIFLAGLPWTIADGGVWFRRSYTDFFGLFPFTTLKAFNIWYVDLMSLDAAHVPTAFIPTVEVGGFTKDGWGRLLLIASLVVGALVCWRRIGRKPDLAVTAFACLWLWGTYMWPTRVHERYILLNMQLLIILAEGMKRYWPAVLALMIVGVAALTWNLWLQAGPNRAGGAGSSYWQWQAMQRAAYERHLPPGVLTLPPQFWAQYDKLRAPEWPWEILITSISLLGYAWAFGATAYPPLAPLRDGSADRAAAHGEGGRHGRTGPTGRKRR